MPSYTDLLKANREMGETLAELPGYSIRLLSNIMIHQLGELLEYNVRSGGLRANVALGNYDNILQDAMALEGVDCAVVFWEACNLVDGFHYRAGAMDDAALTRLTDDVKGRLDALMGPLAEVPLVLFNRFSALAFTGDEAVPGPLEKVCDELNAHLSAILPANAVLVNSDKPLARVGVPAAVSRRYYHSAKTLYTTEYLTAYAEHVAPVILSSKGRGKKALIFDCDNTLWKGILGEDGFDGIRMSSKEHAGIPFEEVQHLAKALAERGVILGLCSKNNPEDVDEVLEKHPDMTLRPDDIVIKRVNWQDKATNLAEMVTELNIGMDSVVFVDDSSFECDMIRQRLPEIHVVQVPESGHDYPDVLRRHLALFTSAGRTAEDAKRVKMYKQEQVRAQMRKSFGSLDDYLRSLELSVRAYRNEPEHMPRISQLTQRTNQFNLTTRRYTEAEITRFMEDEGHEVFSFTVADKFGEYGITGLAIARLEGEGEAVLDVFLMSCRVIGRNIEKVILTHVLGELYALGRTRVRAQWLKTIKNAQVERFFDDNGFTRTGGDEERHDYEITLEARPESAVDYIALDVD